MKDKYSNDNEVFVKRCVIIVLIVMGLLFMTLCAKFGYAIGEVLGEFIYNIKH